MKKIYLAAPVFSTLERNVNKYIANKIENTGKYRVFLPIIERNLLKSM
mgnify:CR=1 FL=1